MTNTALKLNTTIGKTSSTKAPASPAASVSSTITNTRAILAIFEKYQKERLAFVQTIADQANREQNIEVLQQAGAMALLKPLLADPVPSIQQAAAVALGRYPLSISSH
jgi:hypothetical protein